MPKTPDPRIAVLAALSSPRWHPVPEAHGMPWGEAEQLLDAYRAAILREAADVLWNHPRASAIGSDFRGASDVLRRNAAAPSDANPRSAR